MTRRAVLAEVERRAAFVAGQKGRNPMDVNDWDLIEGDLSGGATSRR